MLIFTQHRQIHSPKLNITTIFFHKCKSFPLQDSLKYSSTNVLVFVFKFFSYNQTDNPLLSSTVKYITRINIMLQQRPRAPLPQPSSVLPSPQAPPGSALHVSLPPPVNSQIQQTDKQRSVEMQVVVESHPPKSQDHPGERQRREGEREKGGRILNKR